MTDIVTSIGPASAADTFKGPIQGLTEGRGAAGILLIRGIAAALWTASAYVGAFMRASNVIYEVEEGRSFIKRRPLQMLVTLVLVVLLALVLVALVLTGPVAKEIGSAVGVGSAAVTVWDIAKWPVLLVVVAFMIALLYYASPNAKLRGLKSIVPGAALALVVWLPASAGFAFYVASLGSYNKTYGALGGVIVFLAWLWDHERRDPPRDRARRRARAQPRTQGGSAGSRARDPARRTLTAEGEEAVADRVTRMPSGLQP
jgi:membrane protein